MDRKQQFLANLRSPGTEAVLIIMVLAFIAVVVTPMGSTLNAVVLVAFARPLFGMFASNPTR